MGTKGTAALRALGGAPLSPHLSVPLQAESPWPLPASPHTLLFLVAWPFVTQWLLRRWRGRKR